MIEIQRVYEHHATHGTRFLVERLWPRGIRKESLHFTDWLKDVAPSDWLRRWFRHEVPKWAEFQRRYRMELDEHPDESPPARAQAHQEFLTARVDVSPTGTAFASATLEAAETSIVRQRNCNVAASYSSKDARLEPEIRGEHRLQYRHAVAGV